jgi:hypothetical protein
MLILCAPSSLRVGLNRAGSQRSIYARRYATRPHSLFFLLLHIYRVTDEKPLTLYLTYSLSDLNK